MAIRLIWRYTSRMETQVECQSVPVIDRLAQLVLALRPEAGISEPDSFGVFAVHKNQPYSCNHCFNKPLAGITIQGAKHIEAGGYNLSLLPGSLLVSCVDIPSVSSLTQASPERPYLSIFAYLDRQIFADLMLEMPPATSGRESGACVWTKRADCEILDAFARLASLVAQPEKAAILAPLVLREIHYLLLTSPEGAILRNIYMNGGQDGRIAEVIAWLRRNVAEQASMEDLARKAHMSVSSFHRYFKKVTGISPLQYHKKLRLYEARRLMLAESERPSEAALMVGYESATQFNREYRRMFGEPPARDIAMRRAVAE